MHRKSMGLVKQYGQKKKIITACIRKLSHNVTRYVRLVYHNIRLQMRLCYITHIIHKDFSTQVLMYKVLWDDG